MDKINQAISYQYQILRYRHDAVSGEFANIGIVYFDSKKKYLRAGFVRKYGRLSKFFGDISGQFLMRTLRQLENELKKVSKELVNEIDFNQFKEIGQLTTSLLPKDDNALFFSESFTGWNFDHDIAFNELFDRIVGQYQEESIERHNDSYAWSKVYKKHFDKHGITAKLKPRSIKTADDRIEFDKTVQNGTLHCFQSLSFALKQEGSIKDKIYRWDGKINELRTTEQPLKLYLLSIFPKDQDLVNMIEKKLNDKSENLEVMVVEQSEADKVARELKKVLATSH